MTCMRPIRAKADSCRLAADRYKLSLRQFDAQLAGLAQVRADAPVLVQEISGGLKASWLPASGYEGVDAPYLMTVDDGGVSYYTLVADRLEARGWRGHCFVSTDAIGTRGFLTASQLRELDTRGHVIGSHSASHPARFSACAARSHARGVDAQPHGARGPARTRGRDRIGARRLLLAARRTQRPRRRIARRLHVGADHDFTR